MLMPFHNLWKKTNYVTWLKYGSQGQFSYSISIAYDIYMLFAGWEVHMVKNCDAMAFEWHTPTRHKGI